MPVLFPGSLFAHSVGDYASGTNHTLPTNGYAKAYSGVSVDSFVKKITFQQLTQEGLKNISKTVIAYGGGRGTCRPMLMPLKLGCSSEFSVLVLEFQSSFSSSIVDYYSDLVVFCNLLAGIAVSTYSTIKK